LDPKGKNPIKVDCRQNPETFPAAQEQGLQCHVRPEAHVEGDKKIIDFLLYCGPKTAEKDVRQAKAYFGDSTKRRLREHSPEKIREFHSVDNISKIWQARSELDDYKKNRD